MTRSWVIGGGADCDLVIDLPTVSARHCRLTQQGHRFLLEDLGSTNGTFVNGLRIASAVAVSHGDTVTLGKSVPMPWPEVEQQPWQGVVRIGRATDNDVVLDDPRVSRSHARLESLPGGGAVLEDLGSTNGSFVNGRRIAGRVKVQAGDTIALGRYTFQLTPQGELQQRDWGGSITVQARGVEVEVGNTRLLEDVSLTVLPGELVGVMGPSGAGKTTLLSALNGYTRPASGEVLLSGQDLYRNYAQFQGVIGYVPQDDILHRDLTVQQALYYTARLRLPADYGDAEIHRLISEVVRAVGLEGTEHLLIGSTEKRGISGGQRKRVNLAMELLTRPSVLFLDEPTSGLSSEDALTVLRLLRKLADEGKTILLTVHQPSLEAYQMLDNLIVVARDTGAARPGRLVYYGPAYPQAIEFFHPPTAGPHQAATLVPEGVLRGLASDRVQTWVAKYNASVLKRQFVDDRAASAPNRAPADDSAAGVSLEKGREEREWGFAQWWTLVQRTVVVKAKDTTNTAVLFAQAPIIATLIVLVFGHQAAETVTAENWGQVAGATGTTMLLMVLAALWFGCSNAVREIVGEWAIYHRERMVCLKIPSYIGSKFTVLGGLCLIQSWLLLIIVGRGAALAGPWLAILLLLWLTSLIGVAIGLAVSALARTSEVAVAVLPLVLLPMIMLAGALQPLHRMKEPVTVLANTMPSRWAFEGLLLLETDNRPKQPPLPKGAVPTMPPGEAVSASDSPPPDMAESFFPRESDRMGVTASMFSLATTLVLLTGAIYGVLRARDVH
ncbi:MAG: FHA domain-containing protein [Thermoguttaceae bacterium]|nr:FHA domain-containing protein [Thermoguttaceae bacterium]